MNDGMSNELLHRSRFQDVFSTVVTSVAPPGSNQATGCPLKGGHGGTTTTNVKAVPARPMYMASLMSWKKKPTTKATAYI